MKNTHLILPIAAFPFAVGMALYYVSLEKPVYYRDYVGCWNTWQELCATINAAPLHGLRLRGALIPGVLLWLPFLLHRWYVCAVVPLYLSLPLPLLNYVLQARLIAIALHFLIAGLTSCALAGLLQGGLIQRIATTHYSDLYAAYHSPLHGALITFMQHSIFYFLPFLALGIIAILHNPGKQQRIHTAFALFNLPFTFLPFFTRTQAPDMRHTLLLTLLALSLALLGVIRLHALPLYRPLLIIFPVLNGIGTYAALFIGTLPHPENWPACRQPGDSITQYTGNHKTVAVLASSAVPSDSMLCSIPGGVLDTRLINADRADLRDYFKRITSPLPNPFNYTSIPAASAPCRTLPMPYCKAPVPAMPLPACRRYSRLRCHPHQQPIT